MPVISISITRSPIEYVAGIPKNIVLETNIPATIFYTLDNSEPTSSSDVYIGPIEFPTNRSHIIFKAFATNGVDTSPSVEVFYGTDVTTNRNPRDVVITNNRHNYGTNPPQFGGRTPDLNVRYGNTAGLTVDSLDVDGPSAGFDGTATGTSVVNPDLPYTRENYDIKYSLTDSLGRSGPTIGNLPIKVTINKPVKLNTSNNANSLLFNPKSLIIIQDGREEPEDPNNKIINRQFFSLGDNRKIRDGTLFNTTGLDGQPLTGTFVRRDFNAKENTWVFSYRDSETNRWIFSKEPVEEYISDGSFNQLNMPSTTFAERKVFKWFPFKRSVLT